MDTVAISVSRSVATCLCALCIANQDVSRLYVNWDRSLRRWLPIAAF